MLNYDNLKNFLLVALSETEIVNNLKLISTSFTVNRDRIKNLYTSKQVVASYTCFYLPTNAQKMNFLLDRIPRDVVDEIREGIVIDIGTGPGTYILALIGALGAEFTTYIGIDNNKLMLEQAKLLCDNLYPDANVDFRVELPVLNNSQKKTLIFGNSLNEMGYSAALKVVERVNPDIILFIEPGTKQSFGETSKLRDVLLKTKFNIMYPCQSSDECPIVKNKVDDWCHQVVRAKLDDSTMRLSQLVNLDRSSMPAIIHVYKKKEELVEVNNNAHIMRLIKNVKHAFIWEVCYKKNGELVLQVIEVPKRFLTKADIKIYSNISTGLSISFEEDKMVGEGVVRVKNVKIL